jgi:hypothetical protein
MFVECLIYLQIRRRIYNSFGADAACVYHKKLVSWLEVNTSRRIYRPTISLGQIFSFVVIESVPVIAFFVGSDDRPTDLPSFFFKNFRIHFEACSDVDKSGDDGIHNQHVPDVADRTAPTVGSAQARIHYES